jgi:hypothetical protein
MAVSSLGLGHTTKRNDQRGDYGAFSHWMTPVMTIAVTIKTVVAKNAMMTNSRSVSVAARIMPSPA